MGLFFWWEMQDDFWTWRSNGGYRGGLRIDKARGSWADTASQKKWLPYLSDPKINFKVTDYTNKYNPDYVEDIHKMSFPDESIDAIFCIAVLEHVYDPKKAAEEIIRVLKKDGLAFIYIPFLYRYHAHNEDYRDYFRYSKDGINYLFRECSSIEICPVRGIFESLLKFTPFYKIVPFCLFARFLDHCCGRMRQTSEIQTSGYHVFIRK